MEPSDAMMRTIWFLLQRAPFFQCSRSSVPKNMARATRNRPTCEADATKDPKRKCKRSRGSKNVLLALKTCYGTQCFLLPRYVPGVHNLEMRRNQTQCFQCAGIFNAQEPKAMFQNAPEPKAIVSIATDSWRIKIKNAIFLHDMFDGKT